MPEVLFAPAKERNLEPMWTIVPGAICLQCVCILKQQRCRNKGEYVNIVE